MIGLLLEDKAYEQDIRELLMAFYPGESFVYEKNDEAQFYIHGELVHGEDILAETGEFSYGEGIYILSLEWEDMKTYRTFEVSYNQRFDTKNKIKRGLYDILSKRTEQELPWGTLTGIRPVKIAASKLEEGWKKDEISRYMRDTYLTSREKIELSIQIAEKERELLAPLSCQDGYSLYVGIPFCPTTCLYCSFTSFPIEKWEGKTGLYMEALFKEMDDTAERMKGCTMDTIYFGGGTPTSLSPEDLEKILERTEHTFDLSGIREFTVEAGRPDSITREKLEVLRHHGVTRISINPQTMKQETLDLIGRRHTVEMVREKFQLAREMGFDNINMDLIIGLPGENLEDVRHTMEEIKALRPDSITVHSLAIKRAARLNMFKEQYQDLKIVNTQEMVELTAACAREMGMEPYYLYRQKNMAGNFENVGYSLPGKACLYNILIMEEKQTIIACGAGSVSKRVYPDGRIERSENVKDVSQYIERIGEMIERKKHLLGDY
ncbi:coproporphyrinogen dehydrogenase HemZ [Lachnospiraceae bacterium 62-35]